MLIQKNALMVKLAIFKYIKKSWKVSLAVLFISISHKNIISFTFIELGLSSFVVFLGFGIVYALIRLVRVCYQNINYNFSYKTFMLDIAVGTFIAVIYSLVGYLGLSLLLILPAMLENYCIPNLGNINTTKPANKPNIRLFGIWSPIEGNTSGVSGTNNPTSDSGVMNDNNIADLESKISNINKKLDNVVRGKAFFLQCESCNEYKLAGRAKMTSNAEDIDAWVCQVPGAQLRVQQAAILESAYLRLQDNLHNVQGKDVTETNSPQFMQKYINHQLNVYNHELEKLFREKKRLQDSLLNIKK